MKRLAVGMAATALLVSSCATHHRAAVPPKASGPPPVTVFVAGDGITAGDGLSDALRRAWPRLVFREAFPLGSMLVNGASQYATVENAVTSQLPIAAETHANVALVWLGTNEAMHGGSPATVDQSLRTLFAGLRTYGAQRIVAAGVPAGVAAAGGAAVNAAIARAAAASGARYVDLSNVHATVDRTGNIAATAELHRAVADDFVLALRGP